MPTETLEWSMKVMREYGYVAMCVFLGAAIVWLELTRRKERRENRITFARYQDQILDLTKTYLKDMTESVEENQDKILALAEKVTQSMLKVAAELRDIYQILDAKGKANRNSLTDFVAGSDKDEQQDE